MKIKKFILIVFLLISEGTYSEDLWRLTKNDNGIVVYQLTDADSDSERFLGIITIDETARKIFTISGDISSNRYWMADFA